MPLSWGRWPPVFPPSSGLGLIAFGIPLPLSWGILPPAFPSSSPEGRYQANVMEEDASSFAALSFFMHFHSHGSELPGVAMHKKGIADAMPSSILFS